MSQSLWTGVAVLALLVGLSIGWQLGSGRVRAQWRLRVESAQRQLKEEYERLGARLAAVEARAQQEVAAVQAEMLSRIERLGQDHRAETETLTRHLTDAYDELDRLRVRLAAAGPPQPPDTGQGFAATMPLGDL